MAESIDVDRLDDNLKLFIEISGKCAISLFVVADEFFNVYHDDVYLIFLILRTGSRDS